ncbi:protein of unknown function [Nitrospira defluvii]|uniref:Uncharacterized protein n=1 Tax=Nitrospira defluvii TaxID=330214 RepID=D8PAB0_9BACT|nr:protein of unknown function [Nitrospira defluvii]
MSGVECSSQMVVTAEGRIQCGNLPVAPDGARLKGRPEIDSSTSLRRFKQERTSSR